MGIRSKLAIIFFALIIGPMFVLWVRWHGTAVSSIKSVMLQEITDRTRYISDQITRTMENHQSQVLELASRPALKNYSRILSKKPQSQPESTLRSELSAFALSNYQRYSSLTCLDREGKPIFKIFARPVPGRGIVAFILDRNFSEDDLNRPVNVINTIETGNVYTSEIELDSSGPHVKIIAPLRDDVNQKVGALEIKIRADEMLKEAAGPRADAQRKPNEIAPPEVIIISPQGTVIYSVDPKKEWKQYQEVFKDLDRPFASLLLQKSGSIEWPSTWLIRHRLREANPQLSIFVVGDYANAIKTLAFNSYVLLLLTLLLVIVAMLALYYLISRITDSIHQVIKGAKAIATGRLGYQIHVESRDETRVLAEAFNRMADRLREMIRKEGEQKQFESFARLSAVLTHDLKNQILSLSLLVSNMERKFDREGFKEDAMRTLSDSVNNLENLVTKLSDPRTPTRRIRETSNLTSLVERVVQRTAGQTSNRYQVVSQLTPELFATIDGKAIERVVENLVINALEAMPEGGALRVATLADNGNAVISVGDSGKGMSEEFLKDRLFHPFATTKKKGIGLGLYACRDIIEQHGGSIDVASQIDVGTEFKIVLPIRTIERRVEEPRPIAV
ncbi:MAG: sensor histidine kinase [Acidobacteria bacterium]|nr:sensor histidine kinase [Acidobacteriota bacterium]